MNFIKSCLKGICIGAGAILPGISSGVLCVIFGIYDTLVESVLGLFRNFKKNFFYLLPFILGAAIGILLLGNLLRFLFENFVVQTSFLFIGLILGSVPLLTKKINHQRGFRLYYLGYTIIAFAVGLLAVLLEKYISSNLFAVTPDFVDTLSTNIEPFSFSFFFLLLAGFFMSIGIVVPGVSSTLILMCFGIYNTYLNAISTLNLSILIPLGIGVIIGGIVFLKLIKYLLDNYYMQTFYTIIGFTLGSVFVLYKPISFNFVGFSSILLLILGFYISSFFEAKS